MEKDPLSELVPIRDAFGGGMELNMVRNSSVSDDSELCFYVLKWAKSLNTSDIWILEGSKRALL